MTDSIDITGIQNTESADSIHVADDVVKSIAAMATLDVEGVAHMAGHTGNDLFAKLGGNVSEKGVKMKIEDDDVRLILSVVMKYGYNIPDVCTMVQDKVRSTIENMTGFTVSEIDVNVAGIYIPEEQN